MHYCSCVYRHLIRLHPCPCHYKASLISSVVSEITLSPPNSFSAQSSWHCTVSASSAFAVSTHGWNRYPEGIERPTQSHRLVLEVFEVRCIRRTFSAAMRQKLVSLIFSINEGNEYLVSGKAPHLFFQYVFQDVFARQNLLSNLMLEKTLSQGLRKTLSIYSEFC